MKTHPQNNTNPDTLQLKSRNRNKLITTAPLIDRGLTVQECKALCTSALIPVREKAFFRVIYETGLRPMEALNLRIENFNKETGELVALRTKGKKNRYMPQTIAKPRHVYVSVNTLLMLKTIVSNRKKGYIFEGETGDPLTKRFMQHQIDRYARLLSIQKLRQYSEDGRELPLITLMALRKAGERHHDANGGDSSLSAQASGHTMKTKVKYYQNEVDWEAVHRSYRENHPAFTEGW